MAQTESDQYQTRLPIGPPNHPKIFSKKRSSVFPGKTFMSFQSCYFWPIFHDEKTRFFKFSQQHFGINWRNFQGHFVLGNEAFL